MMNHPVVVFDFLQRRKKREVMIDFCFDSSLCHLFLKAQREGSLQMYPPASTGTPSVPPPNQDAGSILC